MRLIVSSFKAALNPFGDLSEDHGLPTGILLEELKLAPLIHLVIFDLFLSIKEPPCPG